MEPIIRVDHVSKTFHAKNGQVEAVKDISFDIEKGAIFGIIRLSGAGKSTLVRCLNLLEKPSSGTVFVNGKSLTDLTDRELRRARQNIGMIFQHFNLLMQRNVLDNICFPMEIAGVKRAEAKKKARELLEIVGLSEKAKAYPAQLSGGMRQRAALLRTYLFSQNVALLDEPFSALDTITKGKMHQWYLSIMEEIHMSTLFITHDMDEAIVLSDRIYILGGSPAVIQDEITVSGNKQRAEEFKISPEFMEYKKRILEYIQ